MGVNGCVDKSDENGGNDDVSCACVVITVNDSAGVTAVTGLELQTVSVVARTTLTWPSRLTGNVVELDFALRSEPVNVAPVFSFVVPAEAATVLQVPSLPGPFSSVGTRNCC